MGRSSRTRVAEAISTSTRRSTTRTSPSRGRRAPRWRHTHDNPAVPSGVAELERGRDSYGGGAWRTAYESLSAADNAMVLDSEDLELLARAAYMLGRDDDYVAGLERAHRAHLDAGRPLPAVRCAFWIGHSFLFRGEDAKAGGWFGRAERLLRGTEGDCVERGYLLIPVWLKQIAAGEAEAACETTSEAAALGE